MFLLPPISRLVSAVRVLICRYVNNRNLSQYYVEEIKSFDIYMRDSLNTPRQALTRETS